METSVLVTGANSGIGRATVLHLAELGLQAIGTARTPEGVDEVVAAAARAGQTVTTAQLDVTDSAACTRLVDEYRPDAIVNNAGYFNAGAVEDVDDEDARRQLETMVVAPMRLARLALPAMRERGWGRIVNVSSALVYGHGPMIGWYQASKSALDALSTALRIETAADGVDVVVIEPASIDTSIWDNAERDLQRRRPASPHHQAYVRALRALRAGRGHMRGPDHVAEAIGTALTAARPRSYYRIGLDGAVLRWMSRITPAGVRDRVTRLLLDL